MGQGDFWSLPGGVPQGMLCWGCGSTARAPWLLKRQVTGTREIGFCSRNVLHHDLHLREKLLSCPVGSGLVRSSISWCSVMLWETFPFPEPFRLLPKFTWVRIGRLGPASIPKQPGVGHVALQVPPSEQDLPWESLPRNAPLTWVPPATVFGRDVNGLGFRAGAPERASMDPDHSFLLTG